MNIRIRMCINRIFVVAFTNHFSIHSIGSMEIQRELQPQISAGTNVSIEKSLEHQIRILRDPWPEWRRTHLEIQALASNQSYRTEPPPLILPT